MDFAVEIERLKREVRFMRVLLVLAASLGLLAAAPTPRVLSADRLVLGPPEAPWLVAENGKVELMSGPDEASRHRLVLLARGPEASTEKGASTTWLTPTHLFVRNTQGETIIDSRRMAVTGATDASFELSHRNRSAVLRLTGIDGMAELVAQSGATSKSASARRAVSTSPSRPSIARVRVSEGALDGKGGQYTETVYGAAGIVPK